MAKWVKRDRGSRQGECARCGSRAELRLTESKWQRTWKDLLRDSFDDRVDRRVTCSVCRVTYPVRAFA